MEVFFIRHAEIRVWSGTSSFEGRPVNGSLVSIIFSALTPGHSVDFQMTCLTNAGLGPLSKSRLGNDNFHDETSKRSENGSMSLIHDFKSLWKVITLGLLVILM